MLTEVQIAEHVMNNAKRRLDCMETEYFASVRAHLNGFDLQLKKDEYRRLAMQYNRSVDAYVYAVEAEKEAEYIAASIFQEYAIRSRCMIDRFSHMQYQAWKAWESANFQCAIRSQLYFYLD